MYVRVELDFKRNVFRVAGHTIATVLFFIMILYALSVVSEGLLLSWFLFAAAFLFVNEVIRIYLRRHSMRDILENHPRLFWLTRGKVVKRGKEKKEETRAEKPSGTTWSRLVRRVFFQL